MIFDADGNENVCILPYIPYVTLGHALTGVSSASVPQAWSSEPRRHHAECDCALRSNL
eukprot:m.168558 g.168558  ORF g.168558 m.168558 type:complete len:58 (+) comp38959_c0_seq8:5153-5326(+)